MEFGIYSLVIVFASYFGLLDFGLTWAATRYFAEDLAREDHAAMAGRFRTLRLFLLGIGAACILGSIFIGPVLMHAVGAAASPHTLGALTLGAVSFTVALQIQLLVSLLRAAQKFVSFGRPIALGSALLPLGSYAVVSSGFGLRGLVLVNVAVNVLVLAACWSACGKLLRSHRSTNGFQRAYLVEMMHFGGWSTVSRVVATVMLQMDRLAVALVGQVSGFTYYAVPANLASRVNTLGGPVAGLFFGRASSVYAKEGRAELARQLTRMVRFLLWAAVALAVPLISIGPEFLRYWIGPEMARRGSPILIAFTCGYFLSSVATLHGVTLEATGRPSWTAKNMLGWSLPVLLGVSLTVERYGFFAIGFGVAAWQACVALTNIVLCRHLGFYQSGKEWFGASGAVLAALCTGLALRSFTSGVFTSLVLMALTGLAALAVGAWTVLSAVDRAFVWALVRRRRAQTSHSRALSKTAAG